MMDRMLVIVFDTESKAYEGKELFWLWTTTAAPAFTPA